MQRAVKKNCLGVASPPQVRARVNITCKLWFYCYVWAAPMRSPSCGATVVYARVVGIQQTHMHHAYGGNMCAKCIGAYVTALCTNAVSRM